jgi:hemerythrin
MKQFLLWREDWYLGIDEIDQQHLRLAELLNQIAEFLETQGPGSEDAADSMQLVMQLQVETRQHFRDEEAFMRDHDYPEHVNHHREHALLQAELRDFIRGIEEGKRELDVATLVSLKHWLINHVIDSDLAIARYLSEQQVAQAEDRF